MREKAPNCFVNVLGVFPEMGERIEVSELGLD